MNVLLIALGLTVAAGALAFLCDRCDEKELAQQFEQRPHLRLVDPLFDVEREGL